MTTLTCPFSANDVDIIVKNLLRNISTSSHALTKINGDSVLEAILGTVIAAPALPDNKFSQDYYFYWVRDGAIVMKTIADLYLKTVDVAKKAYLREIMVNYVGFVEKIQSQPMLNGVNILGEPKFNVNGTLWTGQWSRPQNDGAAYQAIALTQLATIFLDEGMGEHDELVAKIYKASNLSSLLKANLEYCAGVWPAKSVNAWEELSGDHFSVRIVQRAALLEGATFATRVGDLEAADYYNNQAKHIVNSLEAHWNTDLGYYFETVHEQNQEGGGIAVAVLIGLVYAQSEQLQDEFALASPRVLSTAFYVREAFERLYQINTANHMKGHGGPLMGRYSTDIYDGNKSIYGNPWFLCSALLAAIYYSVARQLLLGKKITVTFLMEQFLHQVAPSVHFALNDIISSDHKHFDALIKRLISEGDAILASVKRHSVTYDDGTTLHLSEQIDRSTGRQVSAIDLSWSYSSVLTALHEREKAMHILGE